MSNYYFSDPDKKTFKAIEFNGQYFARGRGLFIHLKKYFPDTFEQAVENSLSEIEATPENFSKATHGLKSHFKGIKLNYVDLDKDFRDEIKALSSVGEGWWPERKRIRYHDKMNLGDFMVNYEKAPEYIRCLGKGVNVTLETRMTLQSGIEFTREGFRNMLAKFHEITGERIPPFNISRPVFDYYYLSVASAKLRDLNRLEVVEWRVWQMLAKRREEYLNSVRLI